MHKEINIVTLNVAGNDRTFGKPIEPQVKAEKWGIIFKSISEIFNRKFGSKFCPDIVGLQEPIRIWTDNCRYPLDFCGEFANRMGLKHFHSDIILDSHVHTHPNKWNNPIFSPYKRVQTGNGIVSRYGFCDFPWKYETSFPGSYPKPKTEELVPLSIQLNKGNLFFSGNRDSQPRKMLISHFNISKDVSIFFVNVHLTHFNGEERRNLSNPVTKRGISARLHEVKSIIRVLNQIRKELKVSSPRSPVILVGDFNAEPHSKEIEYLEKEFSRLEPIWLSGKTGNPYSYAKSRMLLDHIFLSDPDRILGCNGCFILDEDKELVGLSDHLPVFANLKVEL